MDSDMIRQDPELQGMAARTVGTAWERDADVTNAWEVLEAAVGPVAARALVMVHSELPYEQLQALLSNLRQPPTHLVVYQLGREYGGPEEGGWWVDTGSVKTAVHIAFMTPEKVAQVRAELEAKYPTDTRHRSSVRPKGLDYSIREEYGPGQDFPQEFPRYE
jgi:hypothetical protein